MVVLHKLRLKLALFCCLLSENQTLTWHVRMSDGQVMVFSAAAQYGLSEVHHEFSLKRSPHRSPVRAHSFLLLTPTYVTKDVKHG